MTGASGSPEGPRPPRAPLHRRDPVAAIAMVVVGAILLLPGLCSLFFIGSMGSDPGALGLLWLICLLISAGGVAMMVKAFR